MIKQLGDYLVLPAEISPFEANYLARMNRIAWVFFALHLPVFVAIAWWNETGPLLAAALTGVGLIGPALASRSLKNPRNISIVYGFTSMLMGGLLVHFGQGPIQIEMHFYFFVLLALLSVFANPMVNVVAAVTVALHHLILYFALPSSVFNYDASIWVVVVHALFVVLETVAACFIARSFFDNVIGLEKIVARRTQELDQRNGDMRVLLDNASQGFMSINLQGVLSPERSRIVDEWLGPPPASGRLSDWLRGNDATTADWLELGLESVREAVLPIEVSLDQLPKTLHRGAQTLRIDYTPILNRQGEADKLLVVFSDLTSMLEAKRAEAKQQEILQIFDRIMANKAGFLEFWEEAERLIQTLSAEASDPVSTKRVLHTLKGNCGIFGLSSVAEHCHELENRLVESGSLPNDTDRQELSRRWQELKRSLDRFIGNRKDRIEIDDVEYEAILTDLIAGAPREELAERIASWRFEPIERRLETLADQAKGLAKRLGKGTIDIALEAPQNLRMEPEHWRGFWAAFVHVLRNAVDHGLESRSERNAAGKPEKGQIQLRSWVANNEFHIALADDGRGIDWDRVQEIARSQGLPDDNTKDLMNALFADGVSTKTTVTELSGRGVGLSAVKEAAEAREGRVQIASEPGRGTELRFSFPIHQLAPSTQRP